MAFLWSHRNSPTIRRLSGSHKKKALAFLDQDPINSVIARGYVESMGMGQSHALGILDSSKNVTALAWDGGNIIPLGFTPFELEALSEDLLTRRRQASSLVGPQEQVLGLWNYLEPVWGNNLREVRPRQFCMSITHDKSQHGIQSAHAIPAGSLISNVEHMCTLVPPDPFLRLARPGEESTVGTASVAMFTEEVGYDPTKYGSMYLQRVANLIRLGLTFIRMGVDPATGNSQVDFKADIGALSGGVAQLQGVWTHPDLRGQGIATGCLAAVVEYIHHNIAPTVSLYVNDYNTHAIAVYEAVGFSHHAMWATVLM